MNEGIKVAMNNIINENTTTSEALIPSKEKNKIKTTSLVPSPETVIGINCTKAVMGRKATK